MLWHASDQAQSKKGRLCFKCFSFNFFLLLMLARVLALGCRNCESHHLFSFLEKMLKNDPFCMKNGSESSECREPCQTCPRWFPTRRRRELQGSRPLSSPGWRTAASGEDFTLSESAGNSKGIGQNATLNFQGGGVGQHGRRRVCLHQQGHVCRLQGWRWLCSGPSMMKNYNWKFFILVI